MTTPSIKEEALDYIRGFYTSLRTPRTMFMEGAIWMAKRCIKEIRDRAGCECECEYKDCQGWLRQLASELGGGE